MSVHIKVNGSWDEGFIIDKYVENSEYIGNDVFGRPQFNTTYTAVGKLLHSLKYNGHLDTSESIAEMCVEFLNSWLSDKKVNIILPAPPTIERVSQPVYMIAEAISAKMHIPCAEDVLKKISNIPAKSIDKNNRDMHGSIVKLKPATRKCNILLIDDLYSTGSTANECVAVLKEDPLVAKVYYLTLPKQNNLRGV